MLIDGCINNPAFKTIKEGFVLSVDEEQWESNKIEIATFTHGQQYIMYQNMHVATRIWSNHLT